VYSFLNAINAYKHLKTFFRLIPSTVDREKDKEEIREQFNILTSWQKLQK